MSKKDGDLIKLCRNAMRTLNVQIRKVSKERARIYLVQSFNGFVEIRYIVRPLPTIYILEQFGRIKIPATFGNFEQFSKDMICLMDWQTGVLLTARVINKATTNFMKNNNDNCITSVNDTPQKKESNKNQPLPKSPSSDSQPPSSPSPGFSLLDSP
ncbi:13901_t:CDS:2, partial [Ambispora leptoticha]